MEAANRLRASNHAGCESFYSKVRKILEPDTRYRSKWRLNLTPDYCQQRQRVYLCFCNAKRNRLCRGATCEG